MRKPQPPAVLGCYDADGYSIETATGDVLYSAGANAVDSQAGGRDVPLRTIRAWCIRTGREIASENNQAWGGAQQRDVAA